MDELHCVALELRILTSIITKISNRALEQDLHARGLPISALQHSILRMIGRQPYTITELSRKLGLTPTTLVPAVDALERHGLAARGHDPHDRRRAPLVLSGAGSALLAEIPMVHHQDVLLASLARMPAEQRRALLALVRELLRGLPDGSAAADDVAAMISAVAGHSNDDVAANSTDSQNDAKKAGEQ